MTEQQRQNILIAILVVAAPFVAWRFLKPTLVDFASGGAVLRAAERSAPFNVADEAMVELRTGDLDRSVGEYNSGRNLFRFYVPPPPPRPAPPPPPPPPPRRVQATPPPPAPPRVVKPQPPPVDVSLLGIFGPERRRIAVFSDDEDGVLNVLENDVIHDKFIVHRIGLQSVDLTFVGFPDAPPVRVEIGS